MTKVIVMLVLYHTHVSYRVPFYQTMEECKRQATIIKSRAAVPVETKCWSTNVDTLKNAGFKIEEI